MTTLSTTEQCSCGREVIFDVDVSMHIHTDSQDIFCDDSYTQMATPVGVLTCGAKEKFSSTLAIVCERPGGHTNNHYGNIKGLPLEWRDNESGEWDD